MRNGNPPGDKTCPLTRIGESGDGVFDRLYNADISTAAADVTAHILTDSFRAYRIAFVDTSDTTHDLSQCAISALQSIVVDKGLLHRVQAFTFRWALDC